MSQTAVVPVQATKRPSWAHVASKNTENAVFSGRYIYTPFFLAFEYPTPEERGMSGLRSQHSVAVCTLDARVSASSRNEAGSKVVKQSRKEKEAELAEVIAELSLQVEIKGSCRKPTWRDQPVVLLAMLPVHTAT